MTGREPDPEIRPTEGDRADFWAERAWWRRAASTSGALWGSTALTFVGTVVAARALGPSSYGSVLLALAAVSVVSTILDLTLEQAVIHHGFRALAEGDLAGLRRLLRVALTLDLGLGLAVSGLIFAVAVPLADLFSGGELDPTLVRIAVGMSLATTLDGTTGAMLALAGRPNLRAWVMVVVAVVRLGGVLLVIGLGGSEAGVATAFVVAAACGGITQAILAWRIAWRQWAGDVEAVTAGARQWLGRLTSFGIYSSLTTTVATVQNSVVPVMLGSLSGPSAVGIFSVALLPVNAANLASSPLRLLLFPEQARQAAEGDIQGQRRVIRGATKIGLAISVPAAIAGWFLLPVLIPAIYSDKFEEAVLPARILLITAVIHFAGAWGKTFWAAIGRPQMQTVVQVAFAVLMVTGMVLLAGYGAEGAAIAYTVTYFVTSAPVWFMADWVLGREAAKRERV